MNYHEFIQQKTKTHSNEGIFGASIPNYAYDYQQYVIDKSLERGKSAIFGDTGLGKTPMQIAWADIVARHTKEPVIICAPLVVAYQTINEGRKFGADIKYITNDSEVQDGLNIVNYERLKDINCDVFSGCALDESSILKNYTGSTKRMIIDKFKNTKYKVALTATPSPNDFLELGNHSQFLDVMDSNEMISRFFLNDSMKAGGYRLKGHAEIDFWRWMSSWSMAFSSPNDLGFDGSKHVLPSLIERKHIIDDSSLPPIDGEMFRDIVLSATNIHKEQRITISEKIRQMNVPEDDGPVLFWVNSNDEADAIRNAFDCAEVRGSDPAEKKAEILMAFANGDIPRLVTKASIAGMGMNFQTCHRQIFSSISFSYEDYYQAVRRSWRFGQRQKVTVDVYVSPPEDAVFAAVMEKKKQHDLMKREMLKQINSEQRHKPLNSCLGNQSIKTPKWLISKGI